MITNNPSLRNKSLRARNNVAHVELLQGVARLEPRYAVTVTYEHRERSIQINFLTFRKKEQNQETVLK